MENGVFFDFYSMICLFYLFQRFFFEELYISYQPYHTNHIIPTISFQPSKIHHCPPVYSSQTSIEKSSIGPVNTGIDEVVRCAGDRCWYLVFWMREGVTPGPRSPALSSFDRVSLVYVNFKLFASWVVLTRTWGVAETEMWPLSLADSWL